MLIDSLALHCFVTLAETLNFTRTAERVGRTQSAISQQIAKLEDLLGGTLIQRGRQLSLTNEGEIFLGYARQILALQQEALERFREPDLAGEVRFGLPEDFATFLLADVLAEFTKNHPRILLNVECDLTLNLLARFRNGEFDLVLVKTTRPDDIPRGVEVLTERLEWVGRDEALPAFGVGRPLPLVLSPKPCVYRARALEALEDAGLSGRIVYTSPSFAGTVAAVKAGLGITVLPTNMIPPELQPLRATTLPDLSEIHISLLTGNDAPAVQSLEHDVLRYLR
jgi:DNA-binding transcriptional LysR family regulator